MVPLEVGQCDLMGDVDGPPGMVSELETSVVASNSGLFPTASLADLFLMSDTSPMVDVDAPNPQDRADLVGENNPVESLQEISSFQGIAYSVTDTAKLYTLLHVRKFASDAFT